MSKEERVLMFGWEYPPHNSGGLGVACQGIVEGLKNKGVDVTFVLPEYLPGYDDPSLSFIDEIRRNRIGLGKGTDRDTLTLLRELNNPYLSLASYDELCKLYKQKTGRDYTGQNLLQKVDAYSKGAYEFAKKHGGNSVIHAHDWLSFGAGIAAREATGNPLIIHVHATEFDRVGGDNVNWQIFLREREGIQKADRIVAVSDLTKNKIIEHYGIDGNKIDVVHNGARPPLLTQFTKLIRSKLFGAHDAPVVLFLGRITVQKGAEYFLEAAKLVLDHVPNAQFILAGSGDMERYIIERSASLGLQGKVFFPGFVRGEETQALYELADVYVMPSVSEPFGIAPLEALHAGTPVIISKQSGVAEALSHALHVDFWDIEELANKIIAVITHPPLKKTLAENGKKEAEKLTWEVATDKLLDVYKKVIRS